MPPRERTIGVDEKNEGTRLDQFLASKIPDLSRARAQSLIRSDNVLVDGQSSKPSHKVRNGESVWIQVEDIEPPSYEAEDIPLDIAFEDEHIIVVNKAAGMIVHPAAGVSSGTLVNALLAHYSQLPIGRGADRPGIVHRLDRHTTGLLVVAKTDKAHRVLSDAIGRRDVKRQYRALAYGAFTEQDGTIDAPIGRSHSDRKKMAVAAAGGREAKTHFEVKDKFREASHLSARLSTGRTHQIRVHMAYIGHPIIGDTVYGLRLKRFHKEMSAEALEAIESLKGHMLHSETLEFAHPVSGETARFEAQPPDEFLNLLGLLRKQ